MLVQAIIIKHTYALYTEILFTLRSIHIILLMDSMKLNLNN